MLIHFEQTRQELRLRSIPGFFHWLFLLIPFGSAIAIAVQSPTIAQKTWEGLNTNPGTTIFGILVALGLVVGGALLFTSLWLEVWRTAVIGAWHPPDPGYRGYTRATSIWCRRGLRSWSVAQKLRGVFRVYRSESSYRGGVQHFITLEVLVEAADDKKRCIKDRWLEVIDDTYGEWDSSLDQQLATIREAMLALGYTEAQPDETEA